MTDNSNHALGRRLKQERLRRGLTLKQIEARVGISATHLSDIERGKCSPTVGVLDKLARALETRSALLLEVRGCPGLQITRRGDRPTVLSDDAEVRSEGLVPHCPNSRMSLLHKVYTVAPQRAPREREHIGEEFVTVLEGRLCVLVRGVEHVLEAGDSIHFQSSLPHGFRNLADGPTRVLLATNPRFSL